MLKNEREREILRIIEGRGGFATVKKLCEALYASESSIRRDLTRMEQKGLIKRSYGGAEVVRNYSNAIDFDYRFNLNSAEKKAIAEKAVSLIKDGDIVFLDESSSAFYLAARLTEKSSLTVITNNVEIINLLAKSNVTLISSGGFLSRENRTCFVGVDAQKIFENTYADILFFSCKSLSDDGTISDVTREEVLIKEAMLGNAAKKVFLCDSGKFGTRSAYKQCTLKDIDVLISESDGAKKFGERFENLKIL